jgi:hypothetical protein
VRDWVEAQGVTPRAALALQSSFDESEQINLARWRLRAAYSASPLTCPFHLFRYVSGAPAARGYARGSLTDKTLDDVAAALRQPAGVVRVIGQRQRLAPLGLPMEGLGGDNVLITKMPAAR